MAISEISLGAMIAGTQTLNDLLGLTEHQIQAIATMGHQLLTQGQAADAQRIFEGLTSVDSKSYFGWAGLGAVHLIEGRLAEAEESLKQAAAIDSGDATVQANLGEVLLRQGRFDEAKPYLHRAMELDPEQTDPGANRARAILLGISAAIASEGVN